jgi:CheY-like chemotaxis protein
MPVVLSSGYAIDDVAKEILAAGCGAFIQKPFSLAVLSQQLRQVLAHPNRGQGNAAHATLLDEGRLL